MSFSDQELGSALRDRRIWGRGQEEGERERCGHRSKSLKLQMPLHTLDGKAAKLLRVRGRVGHQTDTWQGARPSQEPLSTQDHCPHRLGVSGRHTPVCADTQTQEGSEPAEVVSCKQNQLH